MKNDVKTITSSIFRSYDIRGKYPEEINEENAHIIGRGLAHIFSEGVILICHDCRNGSPEISNALTESIVNEAKVIKKKLDLRLVGYATTPMLFFLVNYFKASGGLIVTASHNPKEYNGVKVVRTKAEPVSGTEIKEIIDSIFYTSDLKQVFPFK